MPISIKSLIFTIKTINKGMHVYKIITRGYYYSLENYQDSWSQKTGNLLKALERMFPHICEAA